MPSATVTVHVHNTDAETWKALAQVFDVAEGNEGSKWVELNDQGSGAKVLFFKTREPAGVLEDETDAAL